MKLTISVWRITIILIINIIITSAEFLSPISQDASGPAPNCNACYYSSSISLGSNNDCWSTSNEVNQLLQNSEKNAKNIKSEKSYMPANSKNAFKKLNNACQWFECSCVQFYSFLVLFSKTTSTSINILLIINLLLSQIHAQSYILNQNSLNFYDSEASCLFKYSTHLASVHNNIQNIEAINISAASQSIWIGLTDDISDGNFYWIDGSEWEYGTDISGGIYPWYLSQPDNFNNDEHCTEIVNYIEHGSINWNDIHCSDKQYSLCNYPQNNYIVNDASNIVRIPISAHIIGYMDVLDEILVEFTIIVHSWGIDEWQNVLRIGQQDTFRFPGIYMRSSPYQHFHYTFSDIIDWSTVLDGAPNSIVLGIEYNISYYRTHNSVQIVVNDIEIYNEHVSRSHPIAINQPIYVCAAGYECVDATISNLVIMTQNTAEPNKFNYLCDASNVFLPISGSWIFNDSECTIIQTDSNYYGAITWLRDTLSVEWINYRVESKITLYYGSSAGAGICFRRQSSGTINDDGYMYYAGIHMNYGVILGQMNASLSSWVEFAKNTEMSLDFGIEYTLRVDIIGDNMKVFLNNEQYIQYNDFTLNKGSIGLRTTGANASYTSLKITFITENSTYIYNDYNPTNCYAKGICNGGYMDTTNGESSWSTCGQTCIGSTYQIIATNDICRCACALAATCHPLYTLEDKFWDNNLNNIAPRDLLTTIYVSNEIRDISAAISWNDQGYGGRKGEMFMEVKSNDQRGTVNQTCWVSIFGNAEHELTSMSETQINYKCKDIHSGDYITLYANIGEGGGHQLHIVSFIFNITWSLATNYPSISPTTSTIVPTTVPSEIPTKTPSSYPTTNYPSQSPTVLPTTSNPTFFPSSNPTTSPTVHPSKYPTKLPSLSPSSYPTNTPSITPSNNPTNDPSEDPTITPSTNPTFSPTVHPSKYPTKLPSLSPSSYPTNTPSITPSNNPTNDPSEDPTITPSTNPTFSPTVHPSKYPTKLPSLSPSSYPTNTPTITPSNNPTNDPTVTPFINPTFSPIKSLS
eukprot:371130_1